MSLDPTEKITVSGAWKVQNYKVQKLQTREVVPKWSVARTTIDSVGRRTYFQ
jgi:hypothetical protein